MIRLSLAAAALLTLTGPAMAQDRQEAVFAGGCFWCVESDFDKLDGVLETTSGFAGGTVENPSYREVTAGGTGHREVVQIVYDADIVDYATLTEYLLRTVDVLDDGGQFCDRGYGYTTGIYAQNEDQLAIARQVSATLSEELGQQIVTEIVDGGMFYPAEDYHQDYYEKNPLRYRFYRARCGRDARVEQLWGEHVAFN
jgi:peptide-methionine (S)-S-oxide reductase